MSVYSEWGSGIAKCHVQHALYSKSLRGGLFFKTGTLFLWQGVGGCTHTHCYFTRTHVFVSVKSDEVTCVLGWQGVLSCVFFIVFLPFVCSEMTKLWCLSLSLSTRLPHLSHLHPSLALYFLIPSFLFPPEIFFFSSPQLSSAAADFLLYFPTSLSHLILSLTFSSSKYSTPLPLWGKTVHSVIARFYIT